MALATLRSLPDWEPDQNEEVAIERFREHRNRLDILVWGGDWCGDCQDVLPTFAAALERAGIDTTSVSQYPVEKREDGSKVGPGIDAYGVTRIPTIVLEVDGAEIARFVEHDDRPAIVVLAETLSQTGSPN